MTVNRNLNQPFFSVIIPTCNRPVLLQEALRSVLDQTFQDFEIIVIDDLDDGKSEEIVALFNDPRIRYFVNDRAKGGCGARNVGIFNARGKWTAFLDDDDIWLPRKLELHYHKILGSDGSVGMIYCGSALYDFEQGEVLVSRMPKKAGRFFDDLMVKNFIGNSSSIMVRADLLKKIGGFDESFPSAQDYDLYARIAAVSDIDYVYELLVYIRTCSGERITTNSRKKLDGSLLFFRKYRTHIIKCPKSYNNHAKKIFGNALRTRRLSNIIRVVPLVFLGLFGSPRKIYWTLSRVIETLGEKT